MTTRPWLTFPNGTSLAVLTLLAVNYFAPFADLDYTWQIRTGAEIVRLGDLRPPDTLTYTIAGERLLDFEWLYEVILWAAWTVWGYGGLKLLKTLLVTAPLVVVAWHLRRQGVKWHGIALAVGVAVALLAPTWNLRPLFCSTLGLVLVTSWLHEHCTGGRRLPWALPLVLLAWANLHPGVIMAQGLLAGAIAWEWLNRWLRWNTPLDADRLRRLTLLGLLALAATFVSPDPLERLAYPFRPELRHPVMRIFQEMQPLPALLGRSFQVSAIVYGAYAVAAVTALTVVLRWRHYRLWELALLLGLTILANNASRSLGDWVLVMLLLMVPHLVVLLRQVATKRRTSAAAYALVRVDSFFKRCLNSPLLRWQPLWPAVGLAALVVASLTPPWCRQMPVQEDPDWPAAAADAMDRKGCHGNVFAPPNDGAYLGWRLEGRVKCYTDTRGFYFPPVLLEDSHDLPQLKPGWRFRLDRVLEGYPTDFFFLETDGPRGALWQKLKPHVGAALYLDEARERRVLLDRRQVKAALRVLDALEQPGN